MFYLHIFITANILLKRNYFYDIYDVIYNNIECNLHKNELVTKFITS